MASLPNGIGTRHQTRAILFRILARTSTTPLVGQGGFVTRLTTAFIAGLLLLSTAAEAREEVSSGLEDRPAFEREWLAALTGAVAVADVALATAGRNWPAVGFAALGSGLALAVADDGKFSDVLGGLSALSGLSTLLAFGAEDASREFEVLGGSRAVAGDPEGVLALRYRW